MTDLSTPPATDLLSAPVVVDLYRDIHKGIRAEMFATTLEAGSLDPDDGPGRAALAARVADLGRLLAEHAEHEDGAIQPELERHLPRLAAEVAGDHGVIEVRMEELVGRAGRLAVEDADARHRLHLLHLDLATFTADYLHHQDLEERSVMPALEAAVGPEAVLAVHGAIVGSIPPDQMARSLALMLPAMNLPDRAELLGGLRDAAPAEVFAGVWGLAGSVLEAADLDALARRLGV